MAEAWRRSTVPKDFIVYQWERFKTWAKDRLSFLSVKYVSMPNLTSRPRWKIQRSKVVPTAKALHRRMAEAVAAGDLQTLREICVPNLYNKLSDTVRRRKPGEHVAWDLVGYGAAPRLAAHRIFSVTENEWSQQATVGITSTQKLARYAKDNITPIPGSQRMQTQTEYVIITRKLNVKTWEPTPWRIWGMRSETTLEDWQKELVVLQKLQEAQTDKQAKKLLTRR